MRTYILISKASGAIQGVLTGPDTTSLTPFKDLTGEYLKQEGISLRKGTATFKGFVEWLVQTKGFLQGENPSIWTFRSHWFGVLPAIEVEILDTAPEPAPLPKPPPPAAPPASELDGGEFLTAPAPCSLPEGGPDEDFPEDQDD